MQRLGLTRHGEHAFQIGGITQDDAKDAEIWKEMLHSFGAEGKKEMAAIAITNSCANQKSGFVTPALSQRQTQECMFAETKTATLHSVFLDFSFPSCS